MSLAVVTVFLLIALLAALLRKRSIVLLGIGFSLILLFAIGTGLLPRLALRDLQTMPPLLDPQWKNQNAIVVLGYGTVHWPQTDYVSTPTLAYSRTMEAARLFFNCKKKTEHCLLLASGGDPSGTGTAEATAMARDLKALGVPEASILLETNSNSTFQNAQLSSPLLHAGQFDQVMLVTSGLHMRRSLLYFSHFLINAVAAPADHWRARHTLLPVAHNFSLMDMAAHEYVGLIRYQIYNMMGWNVKPEIKPQT